MSAEMKVWGEETASISGIEAIITRSKSTPLPNPRAWHMEARDRAGDLRPSKLVEQSIQLLNDIPYDDIRDAIYEAMKGDQDSLFRVRMGRKLFLIARDSIITSTETMMTSDYKILRVLCQTLGIIADTNATDTVISNRALASLYILRNTPSKASEYVTSLDILCSKVVKWLHTNDLTGGDGSYPTQQNHHRWRKDFRRIVDTYALAASLEDSSFQYFSSEGMVLNTEYGNINDAIDK